MYILFKAVSSDKLGIVQIVGRILTYAVGFIPDTHVDIIEYSHLKPVVLPADVANAWMFFSLPREYINVRPNTLQNEKLQIAESSESSDQKVKYYLTDADKANAVAFMKALMRYMLDEIYDKIFMQQSLQVSTHEFNTWAQQKAEAEAKDASAAQEAASKSNNQGTGTPGTAGQGPEAKASDLEEVAVTGKKTPAVCGDIYRRW